MNQKIKRYILHILYPTKCPVCGEIIDFNDDFCSVCREKLTMYEGSYSIRGADGFCAAFLYDGNISPAVMLLKDGICGNADFALGNALAERLVNSGIASEADTIIPVPLHKKDKRQRGYNQSELIAKQVSLRLGLPICPDAVEKIRHTASQKSLSQSERITNLCGAFSVKKPELVSGKRIILIDDVCTTGSTLAEIAKLLKENNAAKVYCASCCKTELTD
ncbi:MAG: ComF family protein [Ruminococcus sp.]|nr:ComF family protein [Ruminococcus sp.]